MEPTGQLDIDICQCWWLVAKVRSDDAYAQNLYAAMCNQAWQYQDVWTVLSDRTWRCSWRTAGAIVADIRGQGDYIDWYCSGIRNTTIADEESEFWKEHNYVAEGCITDEIRHDLAKIGWQPVDHD